MQAAAQAVHILVLTRRYILWEAEDQGLLLPYACRMGCCTACAVRVLQGDLHQPQARVPSLPPQNPENPKRSHAAHVVMTKPCCLSACMPQPCGSMTS
jgi:ferredoxin